MFATKNSGTRFRMRWTPYKVEELGKVGGNIELLKSILYDEGFNLVEMQGWKEFEESETEDICLQIQW